jgi:hypothetical protein
MVSVYGQAEAELVRFLASWRIVPPQTNINQNNGLKE